MARGCFGAGWVVRPRGKTGDFLLENAMHNFPFHDGQVDHTSFQVQSTDESGLESHDAFGGVGASRGDGCWSVWVIPLVIVALVGFHSGPDYGAGVFGAL